MILSARSERNLVGVHPDLVGVIRRAAENTAQPFIVTEGLRSRERQVELVALGRSRTMNSRHLTGHAVDLVVSLPGGGVSWLLADHKILAMSVKAAALELGVPVQWGGECFGPSFVDAPHYQLPWDKYPAVPDLAPEGEVTTT